jgi:hypothetical protein
MSHLTRTYFDEAIKRAAVRKRRVRGLEVAFIMVSVALATLAGIILGYVILTGMLAISSAAQ